MTDVFCQTCLANIVSSRTPLEVHVENHVEIRLSCNTTVAGKSIPISIELISLNQSLVYAGLLEGVPHEEMNNRLIDGAVRDARKAFGDSEPFLIRPDQTPLDIGRDYPFGKPETIPSVQCIGYFYCFFPTPAGQSGDYSSMTMVWFQNNFAMPIDADVLDKITATDWPKLATNAEA